MADVLQTELDPHALIQPEMNLSEKLILEACASKVPAVSLGAAHVMQAGGKRLRPRLLILSAKLCGYMEPERPARVAAAVELIHTASLVHDDVVDESDRRRGKEVVNSFMGNEASVLMGDYLVCRALGMIAEEPDFTLIRGICDVIVAMCEAEVLHISFKGNVDTSTENYLAVIRSKTANLFAYATRTGGSIACASELECEQLEIFGSNLGMAFQIVDDILDLVGTEEELGKPVASDLREGKFTYPVLHAIRNSQGADHNDLKSLLSTPGSLGPDEVSRVVEIVSRSGGFMTAYQRADRYISEAIEALNVFSDTSIRRALIQMAHSAADRRS